MSEIKLESEEYFEDMEWANQHYIDLQPKYSDRWVAISNKRIVASGKKLKEVESDAVRITGKSKEEIPVIFVECGSHVY